jgi:hypothetical protein
MSRGCGGDVWRGILPAPFPFARLAIVVSLQPLARPHAFERILMICLGAVGDVVRTLPSVEVLVWHLRGCPRAVGLAGAAAAGRMGQSAVPSG